MSLGKRLLNFLIGEDEAINALGGGGPEETISGTVGRAAKAGKFWAVWVLQPLINLIMWNSEHCREAAATEAARRRAQGATQ